MNKMEKNSSKIINDPIHGFIRIDQPIIQRLVDHPFFQRLRRIAQMGFSSFAYPGAAHTRFHHSLGAYHLMRRAINELKYKGHDVKKEEEEAALVAILLHDIGHGPFSHALEQQLMPFSHEELSEKFFEYFNQEIGGGKLDLALRIFKGDYHKYFLCQLVHSQMDMDRLDYLARDSFYTGVIEGKVGYERIIAMINAQGRHLAIEEKGKNSVENFLFARHFMYQQVYHHKTAVVAEGMLLKAVERARYLMRQGDFDGWVDPPLGSFLEMDMDAKTTTKTIEKDFPSYIKRFAAIDDVDIWQMLKRGSSHSDRIYSTLCKGILDRRLFEVEQQERPFAQKIIKQKKERIIKKYGLGKEEIDYFIFQHKIPLDLYKKTKDPILIKQSGKQKLIGLDKMANSFFSNKSKDAFSKYYFCYYTNI